ncbi:hypothetical protein [Desulfovibrio piger]|uniref:hypothetical protein n=1 Tax=Desulfovibrio piger TaxID=901 RepID=UPI0026EC7ED7|nr:hypothetical protein [Desulfovibrio piger]
MQNSDKIRVIGAGLPIETHAALRDVLDRKLYGMGPSAFYRRVTEMLLKLDDKALHAVFSDPDYLANTLNKAVRD